MKKIGQMIYDVMVRRGIDQKKLCKGLCSESTFSRYLSGERHMGRLILCALLQRLGKSADRFSAMLTDSEYLYFEWRQRVSIALQEKNWDKISQVLDQAENEGDADPIKEQFYLMLAGITENKCHGDRKAALQFFTKHFVLLWRVLNAVIWMGNCSAYRKSICCFFGSNNKRTKESQSVFCSSFYIM